MIEFNLSEKSLWLVVPTNYVHDFWRKMFMLYSINWPNFVCLPLFLAILGSMCILIFCEAGCDAIKFEFNIIFLIRPFFCMIKKPKQKSEHLEIKKSFWGEIKNIFHFKGLPAVKNCLRPASASLKALAAKRLFKKLSPVFNTKY